MGFRCLLRRSTNFSPRAAEVRRSSIDRVWRSHPILGIHFLLEHTGRVVAWATNLEFSDDSRAVKVVGVKIVDPLVEEALRKKELTGFSVAGIARETTCSICHGSYVECNHIATQWYGRQRCTARINRFLLAEISIVSDPINPGAVIY
jgi:hypothetical protein